MAFLKKQIENSIENGQEEKGLTLGNVLAGNAVVTEFSASTVY